MRLAAVAPYLAARYRGLARAGREFQCEAHEFRVSGVIGVGKMLKNALASLSDMRRDFSQPDRRFDCLDLTKE